MCFYSALNAKMVECDLQFKDENHFIFILISIMKVDEFIMMQMVHDINFFSNQSFFHCVWNRDEFGCENISGFDFAASVNHSESSSSDFFKDVVIVIYALLGFYVDRLRNVLSIDIKDKLIVVLDFAFLTSDLFTGIWVDWNLTI